MTKALRGSATLAIAVLLLAGTPAASAAELTTASMQHIVPGLPLISPSDGIRFGQTLARGDFNSDGWDDLVVAAPWSAVNGDNTSGRVLVIPGGPQGPDESAAVVHTLGNLGYVPGSIDNLGRALAVGDFNDDDDDDLAMGAEGAVVNGDSQAGRVFVVYGAGTSGGGTLFSNQKTVLSYGNGNLGAFSDPGDLFGFSLAAADFNNDGIDDLAVGAAGDNPELEDNAGSVGIFIGHSGLGLNTIGGNSFYYDSASLPIPAYNGQGGDSFGFALVAGDFDGDNDPELAVGAPGRIVDGKPGVGVALVLDFEVVGDVLEVASATERYQGNGIPGAVEDWDGYGRALAAGDFTGDGADDLIIGAATEGVGVEGGAGAFALLHGLDGFGIAANGVIVVQDDLPSQESRASEFFGGSFVVGDFTGDGVEDLVVGAQGDEKFLLGHNGIWDWKDLGAGHLIPGHTVSGLSLGDTKSFANASADEFGASFTAGRFRGGGMDLVIGAPAYATQAADPGRIALAYSSSFFADGFESGDFSHWSTVVGD